MIIDSVNGMVCVNSSCISRVSIRRQSPTYWYIDILYKDFNYVDSIEVSCKMYAEDVVWLINKRIEGETGD